MVRRRAGEVSGRFGPSLGEQSVANLSADLVSQTGLKILERDAVDDTVRAPADYEATSKPPMGPSA